MTNKMIDPKAEAEARKNHERLIEGVKAGIVCGVTLREMRDKKQYEALGFDTFVAYLNNACPFTSRHAYRLIELSETWELIMKYQDKYPIVDEMRGMAKLELLAKIESAKMRALISRVQRRGDASVKTIRSVIKEMPSGKGGEKETKEEKGAKEKKNEKSPGKGSKETKNKVAAATVSMPEAYFDDKRNEVPESLWPVWRLVSEFPLVAAELKDISHRISTLGKKLNDDQLGAIADSLSVLAKEVRMQTPAVVSGDWYLTKAEVE